MTFYVPVAILTELMLYNQMLSGNLPPDALYMLAFKTEEEMRNYLSILLKKGEEASYFIIHAEEPNTLEPSRN